MLEKEIASIIRFILESCGNPVPYYHNMPESFIVPSVYLPVPEVSQIPDTMSAYGAEYTMFVNFFHSSTELAYELALPAFQRINDYGKLIPMVDISGEKTGEYVRLKNIQIKKADECVYEMQIDWIIRRPFIKEEYELIQNFYMNGGIV